MSSLKIYIASMFMIFLCGCSMLNPFIDRRRNPGTSDTAHLYSGPSTPQNPVICYNPLLTNDAELQQMADAECVKHKTGIRAEFVKKTIFDGKLLLPYHAYYNCVAENKELNEENNAELTKESKENESSIGK